jgi:hypothetical protein
VEKAHLFSKGVGPQVAAWNSGAGPSARAPTTRRLRMLAVRRECGRPGSGACLLIHEATIRGGDLVPLPERRRRDACRGGAGRVLGPPAEQSPASTQIRVPPARGSSAASDKARDSVSMPSAIVCTCSTIAGSAQMPNDNVSPSEITATRKA